MKSTGNRDLCKKLYKSSRLFALVVNLVDTVCSLVDTVRSFVARFFKFILLSTAALMLALLFLGLPILSFGEKQTKLVEPVFSLKLGIDGNFLLSGSAKQRFDGTREERYTAERALTDNLRACWVYPAGLELSQPMSGHIFITFNDEGQLEPTDIHWDGFIFSAEHLGYAPSSNGIVSEILDHWTGWKDWWANKPEHEAHVAKLQDSVERSMAACLGKVNSPPFAGNGVTLTFKTTSDIIAKKSPKPKLQAVIIDGQSHQSSNGTDGDDVADTAKGSSNGLGLNQSSASIPGTNWDDELVETDKRLPTAEPTVLTLKADGTLFINGTKIGNGLIPFDFLRGLPKERVFIRPASNVNFVRISEIMEQLASEDIPVAFVGLKKQQRQSDQTSQITNETLINIRDLIAQCWSVPLGMDRTGVIDVNVSIDQQGNISLVNVEDEDRVNADPEIERLVSSVKKAIRSCSPLPAHMRQTEWPTKISIRFDSRLIKPPTSD